MTHTTNPMIGSTPKQPARGPSWPSAVARVLLVPLAFLTSVGAVKFGGFSAFGIVLLGGAAIDVATILFGGRSRSVRLAARGVLPLHFLFSVAKVAGGEGFAVIFLVAHGRRHGVAGHVAAIGHVAPLLTGPRACGRRPSAAVAAAASPAGGGDRPEANAMRRGAPPTRGSPSRSATTAAASVRRPRRGRPAEHARTDLGAGVSERILADAARRPAAPVSRPFPSLTDREESVLELLAQGLGNHAIAAAQAVSAVSRPFPDARRDLPAFGTSASSGRDLCASTLWGATVSNEEEERVTTQRTGDPLTVGTPGSARRAPWAVWGVAAGVLGFVAHLATDPQGSLTEAERQSGAAAVDLVDRSNYHVGAVAGFLAVACLLVAAAGWRRMLEARSDGLAARVVPTALVAAAGAMTIGYGFKGAMAVYPCRAAATAERE